MKSFLNKTTVKSVFISIILIQLIGGCKQKNSDYTKIMHDPKLYSGIIHELSYVIIYDIFTPPVAARIYAYSNLADLKYLQKKAAFLVLC